MGTQASAACASLVTFNVDFNPNTFNPFGTGAENLKLNGASGLGGDVYVNSLNLNGFNLNLNGYRLILASGGLMNGSSTGSTIHFVGHPNPVFDGPADELSFATVGLVGTGNVDSSPVPNSAFTPVEGIVTTDLGTITLANVPIVLGHNLTVNAGPTQLFNSLIVNGTPHNGVFSYTGTTSVVSGGLTLASTAQVTPSGANVIVGDNTGGSSADILIVQNGTQQLGTTASPANLEINSSARVTFGTQTLNNLTVRAGLNRGDVRLAGAVTIKGGIASQNVLTSPSAGFTAGTPGYPNVSDSLTALIGDVGGGSLVLSNAAGVALDVARTPATASGDLILDTPLAGLSNLIKTGLGNVRLAKIPGGGFTGNVLVSGGTLTNTVTGYGSNLAAGGGAIGNALGATFGSGLLALNGSTGSVNPGVPESPILPGSSGNGVLTHTGRTTLTASAQIVLHLGNYGAAGTDYDQFLTGTLTFSGASFLVLDLKGIGQDGVFKGKTGNAQSPLQWTTRTGAIPRFSNVPSETGVNILPAAQVLNNPLGFVARVSYDPDNTLKIDLRKPATRFLVSIVPSTTAGTPLDLVVKAVDDFGTPDPSYVGTVSFTSTDAQATLPSNYTFVAGDAGVHTFPGGAVLKTVGNHTISATDTVTGFTGTCAVTPVAIGPLAVFIVTTPPNVVAGVPSTVSVIAQDAYSNVQFGYSGKVHFTCATDSQFVPPPDSSLVNGAGTFATTFKTAGVHRIIAADSVNTQASGLSNAVTVVPAPVFRYTLDAPATVVAGHVAVIGVTAFDAFGNLATNYPGTVHITSNTDPLVRLPADSGLNAGKGTFNVTFITLGNQTATATDTANLNASNTTAAILVTPAVTIDSGPIAYPIHKHIIIRQYTNNYYDHLENLTL